MPHLQPNGARVLVSSDADLNGSMWAINDAKPDRVIAKPWQDSDLVNALGSILERRGRNLANQMLSQHVGREMRRLEPFEPGITQVRRGPDGGVVMEP